MPDKPESGESLSAIRRRSAAGRWQRSEPIKLTVRPEPKPSQLVLAVDNTSNHVPVARKPRALTIDQRVCQITDECIAAYNTTLAKPHGFLAKATAVGIENRRKEVKRSLDLASRMCGELYGNPRIEPKFWLQYFEEVKKDDFRSGRRAPGDAHPNWIPTFEYLTRPTIMLDVFEKAMSRAG